MLLINFDIAREFCIRCGFGDSVTFLARVSSFDLKLREEAERPKEDKDDERAPEILSPRFLHPFHLHLRLPPSNGPNASSTFSLHRPSALPPFIRCGAPSR